MARILTFASGKGGVGKTTLVANIGIALAQAGKRVLLIDADISMANLSLILGMESSPITINDVLKGEATMDDVVYKGPGGVEIIPASLALQDFKKLDISQIPKQVHLIADKYDFVILDCAAGIGEDTLSAMSTANEVFLVINPYSLSIADALKTKITAQRINAKAVGIIVNMVGNFKGEISEEEIIKMMELPNYGIIPFNEEVRKTFFYKKINPIVLRYPKNPVTLAIKQTVEKILGKEVEIKRPKKGIFGWFKNIFSKNNRGE
jgi:septum site-determining protein MinD